MSSVPPNRPDALAVIVAARNEADRMAETVAALRGAFPAAAIWVADDASTDGTAEAGDGGWRAGGQPRAPARQGGKRDGGGGGGAQR